MHQQLIAAAARLCWRIVKPTTLGVRAVLLDATGRVAVVRHTYGPHWYLPGGGVKKGESFRAALARELREEVAVSAFPVERTLGVYHSRAEGKDDHIVAFVVQCDEAAAMRKADLAEIAAAEWFELEKTCRKACRRRRRAGSPNTGADRRRASPGSGRGALVPFSPCGRRWPCGAGSDEGSKALSG